MAWRNQQSGTVWGKSALLAPVCALAMLAAAGIGQAAHAEEARMRATVDAPATVPVSRAASPTAAMTGTQQLVLTVNGYETSPAGPVTIVVTALCDGATRELGRFGILDAGQGSRMEPQSFGFALPTEASCRAPSDVTVRVEPTLGDGKGASVSIQSARIE